MRTFDFKGQENSNSQNDSKIQTSIKKVIFGYGLKKKISLVVGLSFLGFVLNFPSGIQNINFFSEFINLDLNGAMYNGTGKIIESIKVVNQKAEFICPEQANFEYILKGVRIKKDDDAIELRIIFADKSHQVIKVGFYDDYRIKDIELKDANIAKEISQNINSKDMNLEKRKPFNQTVVNNYFFYFPIHQDSGKLYTQDHFVSSEFDNNIYLTQIKH